MSTYISQYSRLQYVIGRASMCNEVPTLGHQWGCNPELLSAGEGEA